MNELLNACNLLGWDTRVRQEEILIKVCPFCGNPKWNFQLSATKGLYHAWCCNAGGSLRGLSKFFPLGDIVKYKKYVKEVETFGLTENDLSSLKIFSEFTELNKLTKKNALIVEDFLRKRGITLPEALEYKIRFGDEKIFTDETLKKRYTNRVIVPLFDISGNLVFFTGRSVERDTKLKYINCDVRRKRFLPVYLGNKHQNTVLLVEGVFDSIAIHQAGYSSIPLLSMDISELQLFALMGVGFKNIVIALDAGEFENSYKLYRRLLKVGLNPYVLLREGDDFDCISREEIKVMVERTLEANSEEVRENMFFAKVACTMKDRR